MDKIFETSSGFQYEIVHCGRGSNSIFRESLAIIGEIFILGRRLGGGLYFYELLTFSQYFLTS